jgi:D-serine deaminase-like pyridoxal phosphate-dependent protein
MKITRPTLLLDKKKCLKNIEAMAEKAKKNNVRFRPHFKTHQSGVIGKWFRDFGVTGITVSSLRMAEYFTGYGWEDITVAFPVNLLEMGCINDLTDRAALNLLVEDTDTVEDLANGLRNHVGLYIKIDVGYNRAGIPVEDTDTVDEVVQEIEKYSKVNFRGFLTHAGHSYDARSRDEIQAIHEISVRNMNWLKDRYLDKYPDIEISVGDTPTCSVAKDFKDVDEIRPGNFVFYDKMQMWLGSCEFDQVAVVLACPVVAVHRDRLIIHGGAVHLSKEYILDAMEGPIFGTVVKITEKGWTDPIPGMRVVSLSQEHGVVKHPGNFHKGDVIGIVPIHSCLTANLMIAYHTLEGEIIENINGELPFDR